MRSTEPPSMQLPEELLRPKAPPRAPRVAESRGPRTLCSQPPAQVPGTRPRAWAWPRRRATTRRGVRRGSPRLGLWLPAALAAPGCSGADQAAHLPQTPNQTHRKASIGDRVLLHPRTCSPRALLRWRIHQAKPWDYLGFPATRLEV